jgi:hypothetical protein
VWMYSFCFLCLSITITTLAPLCPVADGSISFLERYSANIRGTCIVQLKRRISEMCLRIFSTSITKRT